MSSAKWLAAGATWHQSWEVHLHSRDMTPDKLAAWLSEDILLRRVKISKKRRRGGQAATEIEAQQQQQQQQQQEGF